MNNEKQISSSKMIHIAGEVIVVASLSLFFTKKIKEMKQEIHELREEIKTTKEGCNQQIKELYQIVDKLYMLQQMKPKEAFREPEYSNINRSIEDEIINKVGPASNILNSAWNVVHENIMNPMNNFVRAPNEVIQVINRNDIRKRNVPMKIEVNDETEIENDEDIKEELELLKKLSEEKQVSEVENVNKNEEVFNEVRDNINEVRDSEVGELNNENIKIKKKVKKLKE